MPVYVFGRIEEVRCKAAHLQLQLSLVFSRNLVVLDALHTLVQMASSWGMGTHGEIEWNPSSRFSGTEFRGFLENTKQEMCRFASDLFNYSSESPGWDVKSAAPISKLRVVEFQVTTLGLQS